MIIYFSGTGNSRYVATFLAHEINDDLLDAGITIKQQSAGKISSEKPWIFVAPTYA